ncbi:hypothetical protein LCGC14_0894980 [marine sediment metagenome]|uniref:Uncharacterized protein n=1 Tax=marine sediment metagenome TaxID=412755 RepID=A0A0F9S528_9ZZZZ
MSDYVADSDDKWRHTYMCKRVWRVIVSLRREFGIIRFSIIWVR